MPAEPLDRATFVRPIAHRGLHNADAGLLENSVPAFEAAIAGNFGIECDVRAAADGLPVIFHDISFQRMLGLAVSVTEINAEKLASLTYPDGSPVLTLAAFLEVIAGRVPVLVELKGDWTGCDEAFVEQVARLVSVYRGPLAVMSFDPELMACMARLAPDVPRGLVASDIRTDSHALCQLGTAKASSLARMEAFDEIGASFAAYNVDGLPTEATMRLRRGGVPIFTWTVRDEQQLRVSQKHADALIFEGPIQCRLS